MIRMFDDFADLWEQAAADGTPVRDIVGDEPSEFADTFAQAYAGKHWVDKERKRLADAIDEAVAEQPPEEAR
jgi:DNA-binding ferritin-like protein (Dps family)